MIPLGERLGLFEHVQDFEVRLAQEELVLGIADFCFSIFDFSTDLLNLLFSQEGLDQRAKVLCLLKLVELVQVNLLSQVSKCESVRELENSLDRTKARNAAAASL